jgi:hypothetical protein
MSLEDRVIRVGQSRGGVLSVCSVTQRVGLRNCRGCHDGGKEDGGQYDLQVRVHDHDQPRPKSISL